MLCFRLLLTATACLLVSQLVSATPLAFKGTDLACHNLPVNVRPLKYDLHLQFASLDARTYEGHVDIDVEYLNKKRCAEAANEEGIAACAGHYDENQIVLHADKSLEIDDIEVTSEPYLTFICGAPQKGREIVELLRDEDKQMIVIKVKKGISKSSLGKISISFRGRMRDDKRGVYVSSYDDGKQLYKHIVSQFQPTDARKVFPCFDEPQFRVPFSVRLTYPRDLTAYGNTEAKEVREDGASVSTTFATTPKMPVHMVAFTIGQFDEPLETTSTLVDRKKGVEIVRKIRVITAPGKRETGRFALDVAKRSLEWFEGYIDYSYPLTKLDIIAIADHDKDNAESWGLTFIRDNLVWIDEETKADSQITTAVNVAHVVVHQWFGNVISAKTWSELWITEGVASQFAFDIVGRLYPFQSDYLVRLATLSGVMQADQHGTLHALSPPAAHLQTSEQIYQIFDQLEFMKSGSLAETVRNSVGGYRYKMALRNFLEEHAYDTFTMNDYLHAVMGVDLMPEYLRNFIAIQGVPVVNCHIRSGSAKSSELYLDVEPFTTARKQIDLTYHYGQPSWMVEVGLLIEDGTKELPWTPDRRVLKANDHHGFNNQKLSQNFISSLQNSDHFIKVDYQPTIATYYRTRYSNELYNRLQNVIQLKLITPMDRLQILDDANSLVQANLLDKVQFKRLLDAYANEDYPGVLLAVLTANKIYKSLEREQSSSLPTDKTIMNLFLEYGFKVAGDEQVIMQRARQVILRSLVQEGNEQVTAAALEAFDKAPGNVALFLREPVYTAVVLAGGSERVDQLLKKLSTTNSHEEKLRLVAALVLSKDKEVLETTKLWLESSHLKPETIAPYLKTISESLSH